MWDNIILAMQSLRANKLRALLTMLGIIIGIGSVIAIETVGASLSGSITDSMSGFGISNISVSLTQKTGEDETSGIRVRMFRNTVPDADDLITEQMIEEYRAAFPNQVIAVEVTETAGSATVIGIDGEDVTATVTGVNDDYLAAEDVELLYGRGINNAKDAQRKVCVVADRFVTDVLGISPVNAVGRAVELTIGGKPQTFYIQGVYAYDEEDTGMTMVSVNSDDDDVVTSVYLPLNTARMLTGSSTAGVQSLTVVAANEVDTTAFLKTTQSWFESWYARNDSWTVEASSMESLVSTITEMIDTVSLAISAIAAISLLVGGIGVMNIMLVSITERTREIGTRKALGAPRTAIRVQFVVEAVVICLVGGGIGILLGMGLGAAASSLLGFSAKPDVQSIAMAVGFSMAIGVFFGYYPADKAAKLDPIEALRYE
ncbi:MAG: ABC transporter permease [Faecalibacterium sp.]|nr:ABC transporter permease [Faecalibacterium sp.]